MNTLNIIVLSLIISFVSLPVYGQKDYSDLGVSRAYVLKRINLLRKNGCKCGGKKMKPVQPLTWNETLELSAYIHAKEMQTYDYFDHHSMSGEDVGERLDKLDYKWQYVGENLAKGQKTFDQTMKDWIKSASHCRMLMNSEMKEVAVAKYGKYWVQHFGKLMPPKTRRTKITYTEGQ